MSEQIIKIDSISPMDVYGPNDVHLEYIKSLFPKLKLIARGDLMKVIGGTVEVADFVARFELLLVHCERFGRLTQEVVDQIMQGEANNKREPVHSDHDVLVHGRGGLLVKAITANQKRMVKSSDNKDLIFAIGPAGTGKTYTAVALAVRALKNKQVKRIILTRPAVEAGENLGFLPGDLKDKLDPYLQPLYDALRDMLPTQKLLTYLEDGTIEVAPLAFMRGRTLDNAFAILDEAQNASRSQLKMFLTRMGRSAKFIVTGDITQIDLPQNQPSGLLQAIDILNEVPEIDFIFLDERDVVRHKLVTKIIAAYQGKPHREKGSSQQKSTADEPDNNA